MAELRSNAKQMGLSVAAYDSVYEGFWDLYCKKSQSPDLNSKRLEGFVNKIKLIVAPQDTMDEDGQVVPSVAKLPLRAIVRIRIPVKRLPQAENAAENGENEDDGKQYFIC